MSHAPVTKLEIVEDFSASARCDEGFLQLRRLRVRNLRADGSASPVYRVDVVDRPRLDAVAVLIYRRAADTVEFLTRQNLRPAAYFREGRAPVIPDGRSHLFCEELVAGLLEERDHGEAGLRHRAAEEVREEAGFHVDASRVELLGPPFFVAPGIISEKLYLACVDVTGLIAELPEGDGSPLEEGGTTRWHTRATLEAALADGTIQDAKTELALARFSARAAREASRSTPGYTAAGR